MLSLSILQVPGGPIPLTIQLPGILKPQGIHAEGHFVWEIVDAIITKFKQLFSGVDPNHVQLFKLDGSTSTPLDHTQTLNEAGIHAGTKLVVEIMGRGACQGRLTRRHWDVLCHPFLLSLSS